MAEVRWLANTWADSMAGAGRPRKATCWASSTTQSADCPTTMPAAAPAPQRPDACAPPCTACRVMAVATSGWLLLANTLRWRRDRRWPYSSISSSSAAFTQAWLSEPTPQRPPCCSHKGMSKMPSPRLASVVGQMPATAPVRAAPAYSSGVMCVACTRHQRSSTGAWFSSHCTGRWPLQAMQSSTSCVCSAMWMWMGAWGFSAVRPCTAAARLSGGTARSECGARPKTAPCACAAGARRSNNESMLSVLRIKRAWSARGGLAPKPLVWYSTGSSVMAMPAVRAARSKASDKVASSA